MSEKRKVAVKMICLTLFMLSICFADSNISTFIPDDRTVDWTNCGTDYDKFVENTQNLQTKYANSVSQIFEYINDSTRNRDECLIIQLSGIVYDFGTQTLQLDSNIVLNGTTQGETILKFGVGKDNPAILIAGQASNCTTSVVNINQSLAFKSTSIYVQDASMFNIGDYIILEIDKDNTYNWRNYPWGQMTQIVAVDSNDNILTIADELRQNFRPFNNPKVIKIKPAHNVGIQDLKITRTNLKNGYHIRFYRAANCYVRNINSYRSHRAHVGVSDSYKIEITSSIFRYATGYEGGTNWSGYGVALGARASNCLVEDNFFYHLRHGVSLAANANGNVIAFNLIKLGVLEFSLWYILYKVKEAPIASIMCHGDWPYANLIEGNLGHFFTADSVWGPNGPRNTYYKNQTHRSTDSYGIKNYDLTDMTNIVGNRIIYKYNIPLSHYQGYKIEGYNHFEGCNKVIYQENLGFVPLPIWGRNWEPNNNDLSNLGNSYYLTSDRLVDDKPDFWTTSDPWPTNGKWPNDPTENLSNYLPAYRRYSETDYYQFDPDTNLQTVLYKAKKVYDQNEISEASVNIKSVLTYPHGWYGPLNHDDSFLFKIGLDTLSALSDFISIGTDYHHYWNNLSNYKIAENDIYIDELDKELTQYYNTKSTITINNNFEGAIQLHDPWHISNPQASPEDWIQPDTFRPVSPGTYSVFLNQEYNPQIPDLPIYRLKAQRYVADTDNIYRFTEWKAYDSSGNPVGVNSEYIYLPSYDSTETAVVFKQAGVKVEPVYYEAINPVPGEYVINNELTIPAGADITFHAGAKLILNAPVQIGDINSSQSIFRASSYNPAFPTPNEYTVFPEMTNALITVGENADIDAYNLVIENAECAFFIDQDTTHGLLDFENIEIRNCNTAIYYNSSSETNRIIDIYDAQIKNCDNGLVFSNNHFGTGPPTHIYIENLQLANIRDYGIFLYLHDTLMTIQNSDYDYINLHVWNSSIAEIGSGIAFGSSFYHNDNLFHTLEFENSIIQGVNYDKGNSSHNLTFEAVNCLYQTTNIQPSQEDSILFADPKFVQPQSGDLRLQWDSPCIDAGAGTDPDGTPADIGALYFPHFPATLTEDRVIPEDMHVLGTVTAHNITIPADRTLQMAPGSALLFTTGKQLTVHGSLLAEGTEEDSILFTSANASPSTGDWNGIIFEENATESLKYCNIHYAQYGIKCNQSDPNIHNNTLTHNNYGIYLYCASPDIKSNRVTGNSKGLYAVSSSPYIFNNIFSGNSYYGAKFFNTSSPEVYKNSFNSNFSGVVASYYSAPKLGPWNSELGSEKGLNVIADNYRYGLLSDYYCSPFLGSSDSYNMRIGGYNSIYGNPYNVDVSRYSHVDAEYNWWGVYPPNSSTFSIHNDGSLNRENPLSSSPGGGSTLSKAASTLVASGESENNKFAEFDPKKPNPNRLSDLWLWGYDLFINNKQADAIEVYKQLISKFSGSRQAGNALVKICHMSRNTGREDLSAYLTDIIQNPEISGSLKPVALSLLAGNQLFRNEAQKAVQTYETILNRYPDTKNELHALYSLVLAYHINLKNTESALKYLSVMKSKYPDEEMTLMAREEMGEKVKWSLAKGGYRDHSDEKTPAIPEEYALRDNYPNPFNPYTTLAFDLPEEARVTVTLYDITGRQVITLTRDEAFPAGFHQIRWDGQNAAGRPVSSGVYLYAMKTSTGFQRIKKMVMVK